MGTYEPKAVKWPSLEGSPIPLGVTYIPEEKAYNFALYSKNATEVTLLLFNKNDYLKPFLEVWLEHLSHKTKRVWHCRLKESEIQDACYYAYRVDGPKGGSPNRWNAFDPDKILLDPYAKEVFFPPAFKREAAMWPGTNAGRAPLGIFRFNESEFNWGQDKSRLHFSDAIIYELHLKGFTASRSSDVPDPVRGTYAGLIEKIPYLKELGVTIVELMPVHQFDPQEGNYWGFMTLNFFSPHIAYASRPDAAVTEFKAMVRALHTAGIEVILDVGYNHTAEGDNQGPTYSFKGIDNASFYLLTEDPGRPYANYSGTGNTLNCTDSFIRNLILDSLAYIEPLRFTISDGLVKPWFRVVDTSFSSPHDICAPGSEVQIVGSKYVVKPRSIVVLMQ